MAEAQEERTPSRTTEETQKDVEDVKETEEKPSKLKQLWKKIDLDKGTAIMMFKVCRVHTYRLSDTHTVIGLDPSDHWCGILSGRCCSCLFYDFGLSGAYHFGIIFVYHASCKISSDAGSECNWDMYWERSLFIRHMVCNPPPSQLVVIRRT